MKLLAAYHISVFQDFKNYLRKEIDFVEGDIRLVLDKYNSSFFTYDVQPGFYTLKSLSESVFNILQPEYPASEKSIVIDFDDITMKTKLVVRSRSYLIAIRLDEISFFSTILGFNYGWDYKHYIDNTSQKNVNLSTADKIHLKPMLSMEIS